MHSNSVVFVLNSYDYYYFTVVEKVISVKHLVYVRYFMKYFTCIILFNPHNPMRNKIIILLVGKKWYAMSQDVKWLLSVIT